MLTLDTANKAAQSWDLSGGRPSDQPLKCPNCGKFSKDSWISVSGTPDGPMYFGGGVCKTHGSWMDGLIQSGWL